MKTQVDNTSERSNATSNIFIQSNGAASLQLMNNNSSAMLFQRKQQEMVNNSPYIAKVAHWHRMASNYAATQLQSVTQKKAQQGIINNAPLKQDTVNIVQRFLDDNDRLPQEDRVLDDLLASMGYDDLNLFSQDDYDELVVRHTALLALEDGFNEGLVGGPLQAAKAAMRQAFSAVEDYARDNYLVEDTVEWNRVAGLGADHIEQNAGATANAAALAVWEGRGNHPAEFEAAITTLVGEREEQRQAAIAAAYDDYKDGRLLIGTINAIRADLGDAATLAEVNARLALVYHRQCTPTRENWLSHLGIAGNAINGNEGLHFTTFNNSVPNPLNIRVDLRSVDEIMDDLFGAVASARQLHATKVHLGVSYHKYYDLTFIPAGGPPVGAPLTQLNNEYTRMINFMRLRVTAAKNSHGRIHHNAIGQQLNVGP